jgi:hypothetical protein
MLSHLGVVASSLRLSLTPPPASYDFPLLSIRADTGDAADWTVDVGNLYQWPTDTTYWITSDTTERSRMYQSFAIPASYFPEIDNGNGRISIEHYIQTYTDDDDVAAFIEFYDVSSGFLGHVHTPTENPSTPVTISVPSTIVPPGARSVKIGWHGARFSGSELSAYVRDIASTLTLETVTPNTDAVVLYAKLNADITGWTVLSGNFSVRTYADADDWEWADVDYFVGGASNTYAHAEYTPTISATWLSKIATGNVRAIFRGSILRANVGDAVSFGLRFNNGTTNPEEKTGEVSMANAELAYVELDRAVPSDTTGIDLILEFFRHDGAYNDGAAEKLSVMLYET